MSTRLPAAWLAVAAAIAVGIQVGAATTVSRYVIGSLEPAMLALLRYLIAVVCLLPFVGMHFLRRIDTPDRLPVALIGMGQFALFIYLLNWGLQLINSAQAALLLATMPLFALLFAVLRGLERFNAPRLLGIALTIIGICATVGGPLIGQQRAADAWLGDLAVLAGAGVGGLCSVLYRPYLRRYRAADIGLLAMASSVLALLILSLCEGSLRQALTLNLPQWGAISFIGVSSAFGFVLWLYALAHADPSSVTAFLALSPVTSLLLGALAFGEPITITVLTGGSFVIAGLLFATLMNRHN